MSGIQATHVQIGTEVLYVCAECGGDRVESVLYALADSGPVPLGALVTCGGCGSAFRCRFCPSIVRQDGTLIYQHITRHSHA